MCERRILIRIKLTRVSTCKRGFIVQPHDRHMQTPGNSQIKHQHLSHPVQLDGWTYEQNAEDCTEEAYNTAWSTVRQNLSGVLRAHRNTHESIGEKPSFILFGMDCKTPTWSCSAATNTTDANWSGGSSRGGHPVPVFSTEAGRKSNTKSTEANQDEISNWALGFGELPTRADSEATQAVLDLAQTTLSGIPWESWCHCGQYLLPVRNPNSNTYV